MTLARCFGCRPVLLRLLWVIEELVPHQLWERVAPLLPSPKPRRYRYPGRRPIEDRAALAEILFAASAVVGDGSDRRVDRLVTSLVKVMDTLGLTLRTRGDPGHHSVVGDLASTASGAHRVETAEPR